MQLSLVPDHARRTRTSAPCPLEARVPGRLWAVRKYPIRGRNGRTVPDARPHVAVLCEIPGSGGWWADAAHHPEDQTVPTPTTPSS